MLSSSNSPRCQPGIGTCEKPPMRIQRRKFTRIQTNLQKKEQNAESGSVSRSGYISGGGVLGLPCFPRDGETKERHLNKGICQQYLSNTLASPWPAKLHPITCKHQPGTVGMAGKGVIGYMTCFPKAGSSLETTHGSVSSMQERHGPATDQRFRPSSHKSGSHQSQWPCCARLAHSALDCITNGSAFFLSYLPRCHSFCRVPFHSSLSPPLFFFIIPLLDSIY